jgi:pyridoxal biosynthesis lyase PdxS
MDVVTPEHAKIAEEAGACAVMALERVPAIFGRMVAWRGCPTRISF